MKEAETETCRRETCLNAHDTNRQPVLRAVFGHWEAVDSSGNEHRLWSQSDEIQIQALPVTHWGPWDRLSRPVPQVAHLWNGATDGNWSVEASWGLNGSVPWKVHRQMLTYCTNKRQLFTSIYFCSISILLWFLSSSDHHFMKALRPLVSRPGSDSIQKRTSTSCRTRHCTPCCLKGAHLMRKW